MKFSQKQQHSYQQLSNCLRALAADSIQKAGSGHPGMVLGMADVMTGLVFNFLQFNPQSPTWFNRDRLVLSAGHGSMLLYAFYYLAEYTNFNLDDIKNFRQLHSKTPGHPERSAYQAIEATTGPLGQGFANSVGMAIAQKKYQHQLSSSLCNYKIYCIVGDGCLMEGISYEAASLAGHLRLNNLIVLFDDNKVSIDGATNLAVSEDHLAKFQALGWNAMSIDGHDFEQINTGLQYAQNSDKPCFIGCRTLIAKGCSPKKAGRPESHSSPLGTDEISWLKNQSSLQDQEFFIPDELKALWRLAGTSGQTVYNHWQQKFAHASLEHQLYCQAVIPLNIHLTNRPVVTENQATRVSAGSIIAELMQQNDKIICGSADLSASNNLKAASSKVITADDFSGNFLHYGVREHSMAGIMNGLALSGFLPIGGTFFAFSDYMKPAIRLSAIMGLPVIYIMTHDSIGVGEDGPTHQPVEHLAAMRAMPNILVLRPADYLETFECLAIAFSRTDGPSMLVLTRQPVQQIRRPDTCNLSRQGAYCLTPQRKILPACKLVNEPQSSDSKISTHSQVSIFASGSEVALAHTVQALLTEAGISTALISVPCFELFFSQSAEYIKQILNSSQLKVAIEAASSFGWHQIIGERGLFFGVEQFGLSAPAESLYQYFGLEAENITNQIKNQLQVAVSED